MKKTTGIILAILPLIVWVFPPTRASAAVAGWQQKGVSIQSRWNTDFGSDSFKESVNNAAVLGVNSVSLIFNLYQANLYSTDIWAGGDTPGDQDLANAIDYIHSKGMNVVIKPHLESNTGEWRANINPGDRTTWFTNYGNFIKHYAAIAQAHHAESLCVGAELIDMSTTDNPTNTQNWLSLISAVRNIYSGKLTYSANWGRIGDFGDEKNRIQFWNALDYIGISAYYELNAERTVASLKNAWDGYRINDIQPLHERWNKPVIFTEVGYRSVLDARYSPWDWERSGPVSLEEQATDYQALFEYWNDYSWMQGVQGWFWSSDPNAGGANDGGYSPQNKPAQQVMAQWYGGQGTTPPNDPPVTVNCGAAASNAFTGCYYNDRTLGNLVYTRTDQNINFDWGSGSPDPAVPVDNFSARWEGNFTFNAGNYAFTVTGDDGVRLYIDGTRVLDKWIDQAPATYTLTQTLSAGTHLVRMEYYENGGGAVVKLSWQSAGNTTPPPALSCPSPASNAFTGCYYSDRNFTKLGLVRNDASINFDWGGGSPDSKIPGDNFSAVWQGNFNFSGGDYTFTATGDDGIRLSIDGSVVIDKMIDQAATAYTATKTLAAGTHLIKLEYYENGGNALAKLSWLQGSGTQTPPPDNNPPPDTNPPPSSGSSTIVYKNGYPTLNGNYIDCNGNVDNDMGHHVTTTGDTDPAHHVGQNCPAGSYVGTH